MTRSDGFTMVEVTVLLAVIGLLVGLLATSAGDLLRSSRQTRASEDVEHIARGIAEFYLDNGFFPRTVDTTAGRPGSQEIGTLISDAALPASTASSSPWIDSRLDLMAAHLGGNTRAYRPRDTIAGMGWSGPYLSHHVAADPWGRAYLVNVFWLDARNIAQEPDGTPLGAVWALSAGPNGVLETPYFQPREQAQLFGDDIGYRLQ